MSSPARAFQPLTASAQSEKSPVATLASWTSRWALVSADASWPSVRAGSAPPTTEPSMARSISVAAMRCVVSTRRVPTPRPPLPSVSSESSAISAATRSSWALARMPPSDAASVARRTGSVPTRRLSSPAGLLEADGERWTTLRRSGGAASWSGAGPSSLPPVPPASLDTEPWLSSWSRRRLGGSWGLGGSPPATGWRWMILRRSPVCGSGAGVPSLLMTRRRSEAGSCEESRVPPDRVRGRLSATGRVGARALMAGGLERPVAGAFVLVRSRPRQTSGGG